MAYRQQGRARAVSGIREASTGARIRSPAKRQAFSKRRRGVFGQFQSLI
jgi:hypothetical protein